MIEGFHIIEEVKKDLKNIFFKDDDETFYHSMRVYHKTILYHGTSFQLLIIALLHDVIEDTKYTIDDLKLIYQDKFISICGIQFTDSIFRSLFAITRSDNETYMEYINRCKVDENARIIKFLDVEENLFRCFESKNKSLAERYMNALNILF